MRLAATVTTIGLAFAGAASAAPVARSTNLTLALAIQGLAPISLSATGATVMVDSSACQISLAAGEITLPTTIAVPVTAATAIQSLTATTINNLSGTFSFGGAGTNIPTTELPCPPASPGIACVPQTSFGGPMGLGGTIGVVIIKNFLTIPVSLGPNKIGQGGTATVPGGFTFDAAPWTLNTGSVAIVTTTTTSVAIAGSTFTMMNAFTTTATTHGTVSAPGARMTLVSPTFVSALGNVLPLFSGLSIEFTDGGGLPAFTECPEPESLLALGSAFAALALLGRQRRSPRERASGRDAWPRFTHAARERQRPPAPGAGGDRSGPG